MTIGSPSTWWRLNDYQYAAMYYPKHEVDSTAKYGYSLYNSKVLEMSLVLNMKVTEFFSIEGGYQEIFGDHEYDEFMKKWQNAHNYGWYGQFMFTLLDYLKITTEVGYTKYGKYKGFGKFFYTALRLGVDF